MNYLFKYISIDLHEVLIDTSGNLYVKDDNSLKDQRVIFNENVSFTFRTVAAAIYPDFRY